MLYYIVSEAEKNKSAQFMYNISYKFVAYRLVMGRCQYFKSVSVFQYTSRYLFKSVRYLLSVFQNITISVLYFRYFTLR